LNWVKRLLGLETDLEKDLETLYVGLLASLLSCPEVDAREISRQLIRAAKSDLQSGKIPKTRVSDAGDKMLANTESDPEIANLLAELRVEGVTDEDFRHWWNMRDLERALIMQYDNYQRFLSFSTLCEEKGIDKELAAQKVRQMYPIYGNPKDESHTQGDDRPLPLELHDRINKWVIEQSSEDRQAFTAQRDQSSSFNSLVRKALRSGEL